VTNIILADDMDIFRAGAARLLMMEGDLRIVAHCKETERLIRAVEVLQDTTMVIVASKLLPKSIDLLGRIEANKGRCIVFARAREHAKAFLDKGAHGILYRSATSAMLLECVRKVLRGERYIQASMNDAEEQHSDRIGAEVRDRLTAKEMKILSLIIQGHKNREVGIRLKTTEQVVKNHLRVIFTKAGVRDRLELALFTVRHPSLATAAGAMHQHKEYICSPQS
jgi:DNA-binding NarL/FixJ family response regulator